MSDDYYEPPGVDEGAPTADIRSAYRDKKSALDAKGDKTEIARINKAWNVLSDPYQRGRYDQQRADTTDTGEGDDGELEAVGAGAVTSAGTTKAVKASGNGAAEGDQPPPRRRLFEPRPRGDRPVPQPTIEVPAGRSLAQQRPRIMAMVIDVAVMIAILLSIQLAVGDRLEKRWYPEQHARLTAIAKDPSGSAKSPLDEAKDKADAA